MDALADGHARAWRSRRASLVRETADASPSTRPELAKWCAARDIELNVFPWQAQHEAAGLARDALYLLRPDTYVALADASGAPDIVDRYCAERGLRLGAERAHT